MKWAFYNGKTLSTMKGFTAHTKRFINSNQSDIEVFIKDDSIDAFLGESDGTFEQNSTTKEFERTFGNLYKEKQMSSMINELAHILKYK